MPIYQQAYDSRELAAAIGLDTGGVVSLVGAGGKTTLMFVLARILSADGDTVLSTTTTRIALPTAAQSECILAEEDLRRLAARTGMPDSPMHITAAARREAGKLIGYGPDMIDRLAAMRRFRWILVEADGASRRPLKAPAEHEPVIARSTRWLVAVVGLSALDCPLDERQVFRSQRYATLTGLAPGAPVSESSVADVLLNPLGIMKGGPPKAERIVFLNQADSDADRRRGEIIARLLLDDVHGPRRVLVGALESDRPVIRHFRSEAVNPARSS
jgi:probable selenium-dependent hydroxylase accessory protein YqeC